MNCPKLLNWVHHIKCTQSYITGHLTVHRVDRNSCDTACKTASEEGDVKRSWTVSLPPAQAIQLSKQWEVDDGKGHIPEEDKEEEHTSVR